MYLLLSRLLKLRQFVVPVLHDTGAGRHDLTDSQWELCGKVVAVLKNFHDVTNLLSATTQYCTINLVYPAPATLILKIEKNESDTVPTLQMKAAIRDKLNELFFHEGWYITLPVLASALDARYKRLRFIPSELRAEVCDELHAFFPS